MRGGGAPVWIRLAHSRRGAPCSGFRRRDEEDLPASLRAAGGVGCVSRSQALRGYTVDAALRPSSAASARSPTASVTLSPSTATCSTRSSRRRRDLASSGLGTWSGGWPHADPCWARTTGGAHYCRAWCEFEPRRTRPRCDACMRREGARAGATSGSLLDGCSGSALLMGTAAPLARRQDAPRAFIRDRVSQPKHSIDARRVSALWRLGTKGRVNLSNFKKCI